MGLLIVWVLKTIISSVDIQIATKTTIKMEPKPLSEGAPMRSIARFFRSVGRFIYISVILMILSFTAITILLIQAIAGHN